MVIRRQGESEAAKQVSLSHTPASKHQGVRRAVSAVAGFSGFSWPPDSCLSKQLENPGAGRLGRAWALGSGWG